MCLQNNLISDHTISNSQGRKFIPTGKDVIIGRGKKQVGSGHDNARLRKIVESKLDEYSAALSKQAKSVLIKEVIKEVFREGNFYKQNRKTMEWGVAEGSLACEVISQTFRDALHDRYKSSKEAKKRRRDNALAEHRDLAARSFEQHMAVMVPAGDIGSCLKKRRIEYSDGSDDEEWSFSSSSTPNLAELESDGDFDGSSEGDLLASLQSSFSCLLDEDGDPFEPIPLLKNLSCLWK